MDIKLPKLDIKQSHDVNKSTLNSDNSSQQRQANDNSQLKVSFNQDIEPSH